MASIAILSQTLDADLLEWAENLVKQKNDVRILTSQKPDFEINSSLPIQFYFKKWSWLESVRLIPSLLNSFPDVFLLVLDSQMQSTSAELALASICRSLGRSISVRVTNRYTSNPNFKTRNLLQLAHGVSFESREALMRFKQASLVSDDQVLEVILPIVSTAKSEKKQNHLLNTAFFELMSPFIFFPGAPRKQNLEILREALQGTAFQAVFLGTRLPFPEFNYTCFESLNEFEKNRLLENCHGLCLSLHEFDLTEIMDWGEKARALGKPIWINSRQAEFVPGLCRPDQNGQEVESRPFSLRKAFENPPRPQGTNQSLVSVDQRMNSWNRFFSKLLQRQT